METKTKQI